MEVTFSYSVSSNDIEKQANKQGFTLGGKAKLFEELRHSINLLGFQGILTNSEVDKAFKRLHKQVINNLNPIH